MQGLFFQPNFDLCHSAKRVKKLREKNGVAVFQWPGIRPTAIPQKLWEYHKLTPIKGLCHCHPNQPDWGNHWLMTLLIPWRINCSEYSRTLESISKQVKQFIQSKVAISCIKYTFIALKFIKRKTTFHLCFCIDTINLHNTHCDYESFHETNWP